MKRKITEKLLIWKNKKNKKPLIIKGARQVGKTYIIKEFARENYKETVYINFENNTVLGADFDKDISPDFLINRIEIYFNKKIIPENTLLFFDEIQANERALTSLKYFFEDRPQYNIIAAGSLLGVAVNREKHSFPVGKVEFLNLHPLDFEEFLWAVGNDMLSDKIREHYESNKPFDLHSFALDIYKNYLVVGGMPGVVAEYIKEKKLLDASQIQSELLNSYVSDMAKYAKPAETTKIMMSFNSIPAQLAKDNKKFQYKVIQHGGSASYFGVSIDWLVAAGIVIKCQKVEQGLMPLSAYQNLASFKLYMVDAGLLIQKSGIAIHNVLTPTLINNTFLGAITENYVANALTANGHVLYYWQSEDTAEVDFIIQLNEKIIPIEVKLSEHVRSRSLSIYKNKYKPEYSIRLSSKNFGFENQIKSVPLYAAFCI